MSIFYKRFPGDYGKDTQHLTVMEHGAYALLLDKYYATEKPLPLETDRIYRSVGAHTRAEQKAVEFVLDEFWQKTSGGWVNKRAAKEIIKMQAQAVTNRRITAERLAKRTTHEPLNEPLNEISTKREPSQTLRLSDAKNQTPASGRKPAPAGKSNPVFEAYSGAYKEVYDAIPARNAKVNTALCQLIDRLGLNGAIGVADFFPRHNGRWYVEKGHAVTIMLADAEKLHTEWVTGKSMTSTKARQLDRTTSNFDAAAEAERIREARE